MIQHVLAIKKKTLTAEKATGAQYPACDGVGSLGHISFNTA